MFKTIILLLLVSLSLLVVSCGTDKTSDKQVADTTAAQIAQDTGQATTPVAPDTASEKKVADKPAAKPVEKPAEKPKETVKYVTIPANTEIAVALVDSIDTDVDTTGTVFRAKLSKPVVVDGHTLFAAGAEAKGILNRVVESGRLKTPAELDFSLTAVQDKDGQWVDIATAMIQEKKGSHTNKEVAMIGGGAVVGGVIGRVIDKKGSTEIGAAAGAVAGTVLAAATGKQDIFFGAGTEVVFLSSGETRVTVK
jgi:hypothetical protein